MEFKSLMITIVLLLSSVALGLVIYNQFFSAAAKYKMAKTAEQLVDGVKSMAPLKNIGTMISDKTQDAADTTSKTTRDVGQDFGNMIRNMSDSNK